MSSSLCTRFRAFRRKLFQCKSDKNPEPPSVESVIISKEQKKDWMEKANRILNDDNECSTQGYSTEDTEKLIVYLQEEITEAKSESEKANNLRLLGNIYYKTCRFETAKLYFEKYYELVAKSDSLVLLQGAYCNLGCVHRRLGSFHKAMDCYELAYAASQQLNDLPSQGRLLNNMGNICEMRADFEGAIYYHNKRRQIAEALKNGDLESKACGSLGNAYHILGDLRNSIMYYQRIVMWLSRKLGE